MPNRECRQATIVARAARDRAWSEALREHLDGCADCAEVARVAGFLSDVSARLGHEPPAAEPAYLWLRAEIEKRETKASRPASFRLGFASCFGLAVTLVSIVAIVLIFEAFAAVIGDFRVPLALVLAETSLLETAVAAATWIGLPLFLVGAYFLALRPLR